MAIFEQLRHDSDHCARRQQEVEHRTQELNQKTLNRQTQLVVENSTKPVHISSVRVVGATNTRNDFLQPIFRNLVSSDAPSFTLKEALGEVSRAVDKLARLDIFHQPISTYIDVAEPSDPATNPNDYSVLINARERGRYTIRTGTEAGTAEGSAYVDAQLRNVFGGAESVSAHASLGTRTRSAYSATFGTPLFSNPDLRLEVGGLASSTLKHFASHEEVVKGGNGRFLWRTSPWSHHEFIYRGLWRQITGLAENASPTIRAEAGDSFKSSLGHIWTRDTRDVPMLPSRGYLIKTAIELAGWGPLKGDVAFGKFEVESQAAVPVPIPGQSGDSGISLTAGLRGGFLRPLNNEPSRISDRFLLGGPTNVRGFRLAGLGPRDGRDAVGGEAYVAGGASLLVPVPRVGKDTPLRLQAFINGGRLVADANMLRGPVEMPSTAAGIGLVYAHPAARVEVNFSLPLIVRAGEEGRKGLSFGVGLEFL
ncbi:hypothetical protein K470DRAFT_254610 [Piedraia hortae CBS 480.64]|uniref:Bacterial surface antigen (D15) domain-containing protein n=1 Tax=Piedraia hortae CBS 480.64 TaxID=1314780 RepID=A0A6A7C9P2_9PEZI|nr:hypothetical protein K470DRAFT_254610 [Piedraia hortae CBS 480.64]